MRYAAVLELLEPVEGVPMRSYGIAVGAAVSVAVALQTWAVAWAQTSTAPSVESVAGWTALIELAKTVGLPGVVAIVAWFARGAWAQFQSTLKDVTVTVKLSDEDRKLLEELRRGRQ